MLKEIIENIKWYDKLYYQDKKVYFFHKQNYREWIRNKIRNHDERIIVDYYIKENKLDKIINKAINDKKVVECNKNNLCILCLQSRIKILFNKKDLILVTILHSQGEFTDCERLNINAKYIGLKYDYSIKQGWYQGVIVEDFSDSSYITFICDKCIILDI